jgi:sialate O-acetylesterase
MMILQTRNARRLSVLGCIAFSAPAAFSPAADLRPAALFSDGMVLQRDMAVPIWGWADPGEQVTVAFVGQTKSAVTDATGRWLLRLDPLPANAEARILRLTGGASQRRFEIRAVLVGDVFQCSGQSNAASSMDSCKRRPGTLEDIRGTTLPLVRIFQTPNATFRAEPQENVGGKWEPIAPENNARFSAVAFYFARAMHMHLQVPIGIVRASHAGGAAEIKMPLEALLSIEWGRRFYADALKRYSAESLAARDKIFLDRWRAAVTAAQSAGQPVPPQPEPSPKVDGGYPCSDWNGVVAPVIRYAKRAVLWYQGEHNAGRAFEYRELLPALITSWRRASDQPDLPFVLVQLPAYGHAEAEKAWPLLRESQWFAQRATPHTALVVTIDRGERDNIHPADKREVGERLALETRRLVFGENVTGCGPLYARHRVEGAGIVVHFSGSALQRIGGGFTIAGADRRFVPATAAIRDSATILVSSPAVPQPAAVRYAWAGWPTVSLFDEHGLPAAPFRTDDWEQ